MRADERDTELDERFDAALRALAQDAGPPGLRDACLPPDVPRPRRAYRVLVADDSYLIREAMREVLAGLAPIELVDTFADGDADPVDGIIIEPAKVGHAVADQLDEVQHVEVAV